MPAIGAGTVLTLLTAACSVGTFPQPSTGMPSAAAPSAEVPELMGWRVTRTIAVPGFGSMTVGDGAVWAIDRKDGGATGGVPNGDIYKIDPTSGKVLAKIEHARGGFPTVGQGALWLVNAEFGQTVTRVDLQTNEVTRFRSSDSEDPVPEAIVTTPGAVWVGNNHDGTVAKVDPKTLDVLRTLQLSTVGGVRGGAATDGSSVWFPITETREIVRIDVASMDIVSRMELPIVKHPRRQQDADISDERSSAPVHLLVIGDRLYASSASHVYVIDVHEPGAERIVADIPTEPYGPPALAAGDDGKTVWALVPDPAVLLKIDTASSRVVGRLPIPAHTEEGVVQPDIGVISGGIWLRFPDALLELTED